MDGIQYLKDGSWYDMTEWVEEEETVSERLIPGENSFYDHIVVQSDTEKRFVEKLKKRTDVRLFVKLPGWFKVATPVGQYNPDWGLVMEEVDAFGDHGPLLYLVRETKSTTVASELRGTESQKNHCGETLCGHTRSGLSSDYFGRRPFLKSSLGERSPPGLIPSKQAGALVGSRSAVNLRRVQVLHPCSEPQWRVQPLR